MLILHARTLDPMSRALRVAAQEKRIAFHVREAPAFEADAALLAVDAEGRTPVLVDDLWGKGGRIGEAWAAFEYLEDIVPSPALFPGGPLERAEVRALSIRAARALGPLVDVVVREKAAKRLTHSGAPDAVAMRAAIESARLLLEDIGSAAEAKGWIGGAKLSLTDMVAAAHVSVLDFLDAVAWDSAPKGKEWYARIKHRPSFRPLLGDTLGGIVPPPHYDDLDF